MMNELEERLKTYAPSDSVKELIRATRLLLLVGPSGAGKDSIKQKLLQKKDYYHLVSHTTRAPRANNGLMERPGVDYHFINQAEALEMVKRQEFVEAKFFSGNVYGTSVAGIQHAHDQQLIAVTDMEVQGVAEYHRIDPNLRAIFVLPPTFEIWQQRLLDRYQLKLFSANLQVRLQTAVHELQQLLTTDYYLPLVNDDLDLAVERVDRLAHGEHYDKALAAEARQVAARLLQAIETQIKTWDKAS